MCILLADLCGAQETDFKGFLADSFPEPEFMSAMREQSSKNVQRSPPTQALHMLFLLPRAPSVLLLNLPCPFFFFFFFYPNEVKTI